MAVALLIVLLVAHLSLAYWCGHAEAVPPQLAMLLVQAMAVWAVFTRYRRSPALIRLPWLLLALAVLMQMLWDSTNVLATVVGDKGGHLAALATVLSGLYVIPCMFMSTRSFTQHEPRAVAVLDMTVAAFVAAFPVAWILYISLGSGKDDYLHPGRILSRMTLSNYGFVVNHTGFGTWMLNSLIVGLGTMAVGVLISASAGYAVSRMRFPGHRPLMYTFLLTQMFPVSVLMVPLYKIMANLGLLDTYQGLILVYCSTAVPYCAWLLKGYFDTIPVEIDEAGRIDGLSPFGTFWRLIVPLAKPGLSVAAFYTFLTAWGEVAFASHFMLSADKYTLSVGLQTYISQYNSQWNYMAASAVLIAVPAGVVFYLVQKHLVAGLTAGGTKG